MCKKLNVNSINIKTSRIFFYMVQSKSKIAEGEKSIDPCLTIFLHLFDHFKKQKPQQQYQHYQKNGQSNIVLLEMPTP